MVPLRQLRRQNPQRGKTSRPAGAAGDQVRVGGQPEDGKGLGFRCPADAPRPRRRGDRVRRRTFITLLGGAAATWPLAARAQQRETMRRIGVLMNLASDDAEGQARLTAFAQGLQQFGWTDGRNARIEYRWAVGDAERIRKQAAELVTLAPDVILAASGVPVVTA